MKKVSVLLLVALVAVSGCGRRRVPPGAVVTDSAPGPGRETVVKINGMCTLKRTVLVRGPDVNGRETAERTVVSGQPYPC